jgi:hypothetical protein
VYTIGQNSFGHLLTLTEADRRKHVYLSGKTGTGKSTLLLNFMLDDLKSGRGFALLDPNGDLADTIASSIPKERLGDVLYFDPTDPEYAVGFNPIERFHPEQRFLVASHIVGAFKNLFGESWGPRLEYVFYNAARLLLDNPGTTLLNLPQLLVDEDYRAQLLRYCSDPVIKLFWTKEFAGYTERMKVETISPIQNKVGQFVSNPILRAIIGQSHSTFNIEHLMDNGKIFIANLSKGRIGQEPAHLLGALLTTAFAQAAEGRSIIPEERRKDFTLYVDEFQNFATDSFASILSEARKYRLNLVLANQFLGQVPELLREAVIGNSGTYVIFRVGATDAQIIAKELDVDEQALVDTEDHSAWVKSLRYPETKLWHTLPGTSSGNSFETVVARSRSRHARKRSDVEQKIDRVFRQ